MKGTRCLRLLAFTAAVWTALEGLTNDRETSEPAMGHFHTIGDKENIRFV